MYVWYVWEDMCVHVCICVYELCVHVYVCIYTWTHTLTHLWGVTGPPWVLIFTFALLLRQCISCCWPVNCILRASWPKSFQDLHLSRKPILPQVLELQTFHHIPLLHGFSRSKLRLSDLCDKHSYPLSHLPKPLQLYFLPIAFKLVNYEKLIVFLIFTSSHWLSKIFWMKYLYH